MAEPSTTIFPKSKTRGKPKNSKKPAPAVSKKTLDSVRAMVLKRHASFQNRLVTSEEVSPKLLKSWGYVKTALEKALAVRERANANRTKRKLHPVTLPIAKKAKVVHESEEEDVESEDGESKKAVLTSRAIAKLISQELLEEVSGLKSNENTDEEPQAWDTL